MEEASEDPGKMTSQQALCVPDQKTSKRPRISTLKVQEPSVQPTLLQPNLLMMLYLLCSIQVEDRMLIISLPCCFLVVHSGAVLRLFLQGPDRNLHEELHHSD